MKKVAKTILLLAVYSLAADCGFGLNQFEIFFTDSTIWAGKYSFSSGCYVVIADTLSEWLEDGYRCNKRELQGEKAFLDTNVFIHRDKDYRRGVNYIDLFDLNTATHSVGDVFRDEFLHWQQCGMLNLTYEEADSLVTPLAEALNRDLADESGIIYEYETDLFYAIHYPAGSYPTELVKMRDKTCGTNVPVLSRSISDEKIIVENGLVRIPNSLQGKKYFVFDLNGKLIQNGITGKILRIQSSPAILKIENHKSALVKY